MTISPLAEHLGRFREAIFAVDGQCLDCSSIGRLLQYASGIGGIDYSAASEAGMYCSGVADYEREEELALAPFLTNQSIFFLTWIALENLIDELDPSDIATLGKIGAFCKCLKERRHLFDIPDGYLGFVSDWRTLEQSFDSSYRPRVVIPPHVDEAGEGVYRVYCLRNHIFHGDFAGFDPSDEKWEVYAQAMSLGTRLSALTIQMGLMIAFQHAGFMETTWHPALFEAEEEISIREGFGKLHLESEQP